MSSKGRGRGMSRGRGRGRGQQPGGAQRAVGAQAKTHQQPLQQQQPGRGVPTDQQSPLPVHQKQSPVSVAHEAIVRPPNATPHQAKLPASATPVVKAPSSATAVTKSPSSATPVVKAPSSATAVTKAPSSATAVVKQGDTRRSNDYSKKQPPDRPGFGEQGRPIRVRANFFPVTIPRLLTIHQYDVAIGPAAKYPKWLCRQIFQNVEAQYSSSVFAGQKCAFDGSKNIYCHKHLRLEADKMQLSVDFKIEGEDKQRNFTFTIKHAATMNIDFEQIESVLRDTTERMPLVQALDVIMRHLPSMRMEPIGRSFFSRPDRPYNLGQGLEVWPGYYQSLRPTMGWKFMLNLDTSSTAFYTEQTVIDFMCTLLRGGGGRDATRELTAQDRAKFTREPLRDFDRKRLEKEIKGLKIQVTHLPYPRKYKVLGVTRSSARDQTFPLDDKTECSVAAYFKKQYGKVLQYPHLPCLHVGQKTKNVYIPLEFCLIVGGQRCTKKLNEMQTAQMIRAITKPADQREREIKQKFSASGIARDPVLKDFGISVSDKMVEIPARVLDPPPLMYDCDQPVRPPQDKGSWEVRGRFYRGAQINGYAVLVFSKFVRDDEVDRFTELLRRVGSERGMTFHGERIVQRHNPRRINSIESTFRELKTKTKVNLIIAIIDKGPLYGEIKRIGDTTDSGIATQCVMSNTVQRKCNPATVGNICLKINPKLGGINNIIQESSRPVLLQQEPVIIFGADVTHPRAGDTTSPSIAAVVASMDRTASKFKGKHHVQKHRQEIIANLKDMTKELLKDFYRATRYKPTRIIFYRDGVSEGQFNEVRVMEIAALQQACTELGQSYQPGITFLVVQKRHHTRLFPVNPKDGGKGNNVPPGTIVEREITHPNEFDFYLCSHAAIQGTSRPCHYHVLWDDNDFTADDLQTLSYQLCHTFWRCTRSVSYPAPAYYAHRAAAHARVLLLGYEEQWSSDGGSVSSGSSIGMEQMDEAITIHVDRSGDMYFM